MEGQFFFTTIAGLGVSLAGFAGLVGALRPGRSWDAVDRWRIRNIIQLGFLAALIALLPIPVFTLTSDVDLTVRIASACLVVATLLEFVGVHRRDTEEWPSGASGYVAAGLALQVIPGLANVLLASLGLLEILLLVRLSHPANIFLRVVRDLGKGQQPEALPGIES
jgi:hypothetical protein